MSATCSTCGSTLLPGGFDGPVCPNAPHWAWANGECIRGADRIGLYASETGSQIRRLHSRGRMPFLQLDGTELVAQKADLDRWCQLPPSARGVR
jgi:hypothetical protein